MKNQNRLTRRNLFGLPARPQASPPDAPAFSLDGFYARRELRGASKEVPHFELRAGLPNVATTRVGTGEQPQGLVDKTLPAVVAAPLSRPVRIEQKHCLAWQRSFCSVCSERCPEPGAISVAMGRPQVNQAACTGCGICVQVCPAPVNAFATVEQEVGSPQVDEA